MSKDINIKKVNTLTKIPKVKEAFTTFFIVVKMIFVVEKFYLIMISPPPW